MDVLTDVLNALDLKGWLHSRTEAAAPWRFDFEAGSDSSFHVLSRGGGYLYVDGDASPLRIEEGDVIVFPHGDTHTICDAPRSPVTQVVRLDYHADREYQVFPLAGEGAAMVMLCGAFHVQSPGSVLLLRRLPAIIHIPGEGRSVSDGIAAIVSRIATESAQRRPGADAMLRRLAEMLFIEVIRSWIEQQSPTTGGWLGALRDQAVTTALGLMHQHPELRWTVQDLANTVALSRSAFSARFTALVGEPPMTYLTHWRMHLAMRLLRGGTNPARIAERVGYDSDIAFRKAFRRETGTTPSRWSGSRAVTEG